MEQEVKDEAETVADPPRDSHALAAEEVVRQLGVAVDSGLTEAEAERRLAQFGPNALLARPRATLLEIAVNQVKSPVVLLLAAAALVSAVFGQWSEAIAILVVLLINSAIGFITELRAVRSMEALRQLGSRSSRVRRDGRVKTVSAEALTPGDIVVLDGGDVITADLRLLEAANLWCDESTLTGESVPVEKSIAPVAEDAPVADRSSMGHKGTAITRGSGLGVVVATGMDTELGKITKLVAEAEPDISPLERKLERLAAQLIKVTLLLTGLIAVAGIATGKDILLMIEASIALAVAAIPEGLPIVATMALARGMWRMAQRNALVERLSAVETLGATTVICTDKTGTLTENRMTVERLSLPLGEYVIDYEHGHIIAERREGEDELALTRALTAGVLCSNATLQTEDGSGGDPMELALLRAGRVAGLEREALLAEWPETQEQAFDPETKMMATAHRRDGKLLVAIKGAPEAVLAASTRLEDGRPLDDSGRAAWLERADDMAGNGLRLLALADRTITDEETITYEDLTFLGLVGFRDPPRADVRHAIETCRQAGMRVVMVTGDHALTARTVAESVGIAEREAAVIEGRALKPLEQMDQPARERLLAASIFARVSPAQKLDLISLYQAVGEVVAMTGDGVNDAPALQKADIGVAMGLRGTDVAREASDIVLRDDAFSTIVAAVREGRVVFTNLRRFAAYLLSCNISEILAVALAILAGLPLPILPLQILFLNLVTDVFPAFALGAGEGEKDILRQPPRDPKEPLLGRRQWWFIAFYGGVLTAATLGALVVGNLWLDLHGEALVTVSFLTLAFSQLLHVFNMRGHGAGVFRNAVTTNPWVWAATALCVLLLLVAVYLPPLADVLRIVPPEPSGWALILGASVAPALVGALIAGARRAGKIGQRRQV